MYISSKKLNWSEVIDQWESEKNNFTYNTTGNNFTLIGNYSQVIQILSHHIINRWQHTRTIVIALI